MYFTKIRPFPPYRGSHFNEFLDLMAILKKGECDGVKIRLGLLQVTCLVKYATFPPIYNSPYLRPFSRFVFARHLFPVPVLNTWTL